MLAEEQDVRDRAGFTGFHESTLQGAGGSVGQQPCVHLPANFFWMVHESVAISGGLPPISIALTAQARLPVPPKPFRPTFFITH